MTEDLQRNLLSWSRDPSSALFPGDAKTDPDADGVWTGAAVIGPDGNMHIFYTGYNLSQNGKQVIIHAYSGDPHGTSFKKSSEPITINSGSSSLSAFEDIDFRDPYVMWNEQDGKYWMLVATRLSSGPHWTRGCIALLTSLDLQSWSLSPKPLFAPNDMFCPECPELFTLPLTGKWYLVYSRFSSPNAGTVYRISDSPYGPFHIPRDGSMGRLDGRRWYAAKSCPKMGDPNKRIYFGWIADRCVDDERWMWGGDMSLREVSANVDGTLRIDPVKEIFENVCSSEDSLSMTNLKLQSSGTTSVKFLDFSKDHELGAPYLLTVKTSMVDAFSFGLLFRTDDDFKGYCLRCVTTGDNKYTVSLAVTPPPLDDFWADQYNLYLPREVDGPDLVRHEKVKIDKPIQVLIVGQTIEIFVGGRVLSYRMTDVNAGKGAHELGVFADDGTVCFSQITVRSFM